MIIDPFARWYRWFEYAAFGRALERSRFAFLGRLTGARHILILGEGDGRALMRLRASSPQAQIEVVETSSKMIELARGRIGDTAQVSFRQEDALTARFRDNHYDAVLTLFFLDCFSEPETRDLIHRTAGAMKAGGVWLVSDFAVPLRGWRRRHARIWLWTLYQFFGIVTGLRTRVLPPMESLLAAAGLELCEREEERWGLIRSEMWRKAQPQVE